LAVAGTRRVFGLVEDARIHQFAEVVDGEKAGGQFVVDIGHIDDRVRALVHQHQRKSGETEIPLQTIQVGLVDADLVAVPVAMKARFADIADLDRVLLEKSIQARSEGLGAAVFLAGIAKTEQRDRIPDIVLIHRYSCETGIPLQIRYSLGYQWPGFSDVP